MECRKTSCCEGAAAMNRRWLRYLLAIVAGGAGGFAYYYYIGCLAGTCPITSNPWISTAYGALIGWLAVPKPSASQTIPSKETTTEKL